MVKIRRYNIHGSTQVSYILEEAEQIAQEAWDRGCLVYNEDTGDVLCRGAALKEDNAYAVVPAIAGGS